MVARAAGSAPPMRACKRSPGGITTEPMATLSSRARATKSPLIRNGCLCRKDGFTGCGREAGPRYFRLVKQVRVKKASQFFQGIHQARPRPADEIVVEGVDRAGFHRGPVRPAGALANGRPRDAVGW